MSNGEMRDAVIFLCLILVVLALVWRTRHNVGILPPAVSPQSMPIEEQMRDARHRVANLEQHLPLLNDHGSRLRAVEQASGELKSKLDGLAQGQLRIERQLDMVISHHVERNQ